MPAARLLAEDGIARLEGHGGPVMDIATKGDTVLTASFDNSVGVWSLGAAGPRWLEGHAAAVKTVTFFGEGRAISGGDDFALQLWDLQTGGNLGHLEGHKGQIADIAVRAETIASASWDGSIGLWREGRARWLEGHEAPVNAVAFDGAGQLYSASADGTIRLWSPQGDPLRVLARHGFGVTELVLHEAGGWLAYGAVDGGTRVLDLATGETLADLTLERRPILALALSADASRLAVGDGDGYIMVVDTADWTITHDFRAALKGPIWALAYTEDGRIIAGGIDDAAVIWTGEGAQTPAIGVDTRSFLRAPETMSNGERQFRRKCSICHTLVDDGSRRAGPTLAGLFGRRAGSVEEYSYSEALSGADFRWSDDTIDQLFDLGPEHFVPGSKMPMQRITSSADRRDLISFLKENTGKGNSR